MSVKQNQAVAEGILTLSNTENQTNSTNNDGFVVRYYDVFGVAREYWLSSYNDLRTNKNTITYQLYREPVSPQITIKQDGIEVTSINLEKTGGTSSVIEIISTHPISIYKGIKSISYTVDDASVLDESRANFEYVLGEPRVESDGNYHYFLTLTPTMTNPGDTIPVKLGDLTFTSQIYKNGTRPNKWVVVEDTVTGLEIVKTLLRTDTVNIIDLGSDLGGINSGIPFELNSLPSITNAVPGTVYRGKSSTVGNNAIFYASGEDASGSSASQTKLFVAIPYGLTKESYGTGDVDFVASNNRYYYSQKEIDNTFGSAYRRVSVIQKGDYTYTLSGENTGDKTRDINFLGETRNYDITITPANEREIDYIIGTTENCQVTTNNNQITMSVPNRILDYSPRSIADTYYTDLFSKLPVSFDVLISTVTSKDMNNLASNSQLGSLSTIKDTFLKLSSMPTQGTSGIDPEPAPIYYRDPVSGMMKFVRTIGTYNYDYRGVKRTGYTCKTITWSKIRYTEVMKFSRNRKYGFQENEEMTGYNTGANTVTITNSLPDNTDDILIPGVYSLRTEPIPDRFITVDSFPMFAKIGEVYKVGLSFYDFKASSNINVQHLCLVPLVQWSNMDEGEQMYKTLKYDKNGYFWNTITAPLQQFNPNGTYIDRTPVMLPSSGAPASSSTLGQYRYLWDSINISTYDSSTSYVIGDKVTYNSKVWECIQASTGNTPADGSLYWSDITSSVEQVSALPTTRDAVNSSTIYKYYQGGQYYYYRLGVYQVCEMNPIYSIVSTSLPETWTPGNSYDVGEYVIDSADSSIWECKAEVLTSSTAPHSDTDNIWQKVGDIYTYGTTHYKYYHVNSVPDPVNTPSYGSLPSADNLNSPDYIKVTGVKTNYYRRGYNFVDADGDPDFGIFDASGPRTDRFFKIGNELFKLKNFAPEIACPNKFKTSTGTIESVLINADYPVSIVLKGDDSGSGFGMTNQTEMGGYYFVDFNDYTVKTQAFEEKVDLKQKRVSKGIVFKLSDDTEYKLYLGENEKNTINISVDPNTESVEACVGVFSLQNPITSTSSGSNPRVNTSGATCQYSLTSPSLDGSTNNLRIEFGKNERDSDLVRTFEFSYTEDALNTLVTLVITQTSDPGEVRFSGNRRLYFLSNGLLTNSTDFGYFTFSTTIRNFTLDNIEIIDDFGNDLLDREKSLLGNPVTQSATYNTYRAQLVLKPNTKNYKLEKVRVKIGKVSGNTVMDRTLDESSASYWRWNGTAWIEQTGYTPTFLETYYDVLPEIGETSDVVCVCNSLRAYQGYYSVALFNPGSTDTDISEMTYRQTTDPNEIYQDFGYTEAPSTIPGLITNISSLPDIKTQKIVGLIYKIGEVYYYTYSDFITSGYTYGTTNLPIATGTGTEGQQKLHTTVEQCEYDSNGNTTSASLTDTFFDLASNYGLSSTSWKLWDASGQTPISTEVMDPRNYCSIRAVYSDSQNPDLVPYIETSYHSLPQGSTVNIEVDIILRVRYNYSGSVSIDDDYKWIENNFTVYTRREWNNS